MLQRQAPGADLTTGEYLRQWLTHAKGRVRATTYEGYEALVRCHALPALGSVPLGSLHPLDVQRLYAELLEGRAPGASAALSAKTVGNLHRVLRQALGQAVRWRLVQYNAAASAEPPRSRRPELAVVDRDLAGRILEAATRTPLEAPVAIAVATGMRRGEILGLRWADVDTATGVARVCRSLQPTADGLVFEQPKTARSRRAVTLPHFLLPYLERQRERQDQRRQELGDRWCEHGLVVDHGDGSPWHPDRFSSAWPGFLRRHGLPHVRFHDLRHGHATLMLAKGVHPKIVSERLGHASVGITLDTYSHVLPTMQAEAARAFDEIFAAPALTAAPRVVPR